MKRNPLNMSDEMIQVVDGEKILNDYFDAMKNGRVILMDTDADPFGKVISCAHDFDEMEEREHFNVKLFLQCKKCKALLLVDKIEDGSGIVSYSERIEDE